MSDTTNAHSEDEKILVGYLSI